MKRVHIIGGKNQGKTTLVVDLISYFLSLDMRIGSIKHTHHAHELDVPGKDSHRHRLAGAEAVGILSGRMNALFWSPSQQQEDDQSKYDDFAPSMEHCDLVVVEGDQQAAGLKIEVWRAACQEPPLAQHHPSIAAVVSDDEPAVNVPVFPRHDLCPLGEFLLSKLQVEAATL